MTDPILTGDQPHAASEQLKVTLLGFTVPSEVMEQLARTDRVLPAQTHNFAWSFVDTLTAGGASVDLISTVPASNFPNNPKVAWRRSSFKQGGVEGILIPFINLPLLKHLSRFASCGTVARQRLAANRPSWILVHGVHSPFLWFAALHRAMNPQVRIAAILTDPPGVAQPGDSAATRMMRRVDVALVKLALRRFDGVICVAKGLGTTFAPNIPNIVVEGISRSLPSIAAKPESTTSRPYFVYAGGLSRSYGVDVLLNAMRESDLDADLWLLGRGELEDGIRDAALADARIHGPEVLDRDQLALKYASAIGLIQPRLVNQQLNLYSFPSKLIEYMASGRPVISTRLPSIPSDYEPYVCWAETDDTGGISSAMVRVLNMSETERAAFGGSAKVFIESTRSPTQVGARLVAWLEKLA